MKSTGKIIYEFRMKKGISQEELATMAKVNLRTIQRIENDLTAPRETTINLIFGVLEIDHTELKLQLEEKRAGNIVQKLINGLFLIVLNLTIASLVVYLTVYDNANIYTRIAAFLLCILFSYFVVSLTRNAASPVRLLKFGTGFIVLIIFSLFQVKRLNKSKNKQNG